MFATGEVIQHYTTLYSCKFFRNRVLRLQKLCTDLGLDAIVLINGDDVHRDREMGKLSNWLLFGLSSNDICGGIHNSSLYEDSFFVISKDGFQGYTSSQGFKELSNLTTLVQNCNLYILTKSDEAEMERSEVLKMSRFYEMVHDKKSLGMPVRKLNPKSDFVSNEKELIEKWPIIQAYGLDMVGGGFFTMKHNFKLVREELNTIYKDYDAFTKYRAVNEEIIRLNTHYFDNFFLFNQDAPSKRTQRTEHDLIESFWLRYQHSLVQRKNIETKDVDETDGLPLTRVLIGANSNKPYTEVSDTESRMFKFNNIDDKNGALHFTMEYVEKNTNLRFARTYFLTNLSQNYMKNMFFSQDEEFRVTDSQGKVNEQNTKVLFDVYKGLIKTYQECSENYLKGTTTAAEIQNGTAFAAFKTFMSSRCDNFDNLLKDGKDSFVVDIHHINTYGQSTVQNEKCNQDRLIMIRIQVKDVMSQVEKDNNLGSVLYAQSFIVIEANQIHINLTKGVPNLQAWYTNNKHFENLPTEINTMKNLDNEHLGERLMANKEGGVLYQNLHGLLPIKEDQQNEFDDIVLNGKLVFYQKGMIFVDSKLHSIVLPWCMIKEMNVYQTKQWWLEIICQDNEDLGIKAASLFPSNMIAQTKMYLKIDQRFYEDKFRYLEKEFLVNPEKNLDGNSGVKKLYTECPLVHDSQAMKNFFVNQKYHKVHSSDFLNFEFDEDLYLEYMEYNSLSEFNRTKGKEFLPFTSYSKHYKDARLQAKGANSKAKDLIEKLVDGTKTNVIIISGIPGSGKGRLADFMSRQIRMENVPSTNFKMATVQESVKFSSEAFINAMIQFKNTDEDAKNAKVIVATIPSYNHLKKAIFDLKKSETFGALFNVSFVVTKVAAKNFYMNKNRNCYQFLIENCMKGVSNAVIFEKQNMPQGEIDIMLRTLQNANFSRNVIMTTGKSFEFDDLAKVICYQNEKFSQLYNKFFYGFEKEGKSAYYLDNLVSGAYFNYRYLFNTDMVKEQLKTGLSLPLADDTINKFIRVKTESEKAKEAKEAEEEELKISQMENLQKKRYLREKKRKAQIDEDLLQERELREEMELIKRKVGAMGTKEPFVERFRGYVNIEGEKGTDQDHQMCVNFGDLSVKGLKNQSNRLDKSQLGFLVYGKNLTDAKGNVSEAIKETLKCVRTHLTEKREKRTRESITEEEITTLENDHIGKDMPEDGNDWSFAGSYYINNSTNAKLWEHPNREFLIQRFLDEDAGTVAAFNSDVQRQWQEDAQKYQ